MPSRIRSLAVLLFLATSIQAAEVATSHTARLNAAVKTALDFADQESFADATRGFIAPLPDNGLIKDAAGKVVWNPAAFAFLDGEAPDTVNPSLWRQSQLCMKGGLFEVVPDAIYQVRNADISNITFFEGTDGIVVADPLISTETARVAMELYYAHRPKKPVKAVIYSHSHIDHYGGVLGVTAPEFTNGKAPEIVAPEGFMEEVVSENAYAGNIMSRRSIYMYGRMLPRSVTGNVGTGLGMTTSSGVHGLLAPTITIRKTGEKLTLAGIEFEFLMAPHTEAPAEMHWYIEQWKALTTAENCCQTLHNTYTLRGAKTRDPLSWSRYLNETMHRWGENCEVLYGMHHWPIWGNAKITSFLTMGRDGYRFINDQTLRLANMGHTPDQIAETLRFPEAIERHWGMRGYYGTLFHNLKATFSLYLGWYDGNPATLYTLPRSEAAVKYLHYMGGAEAMLVKAHEDYANGEYRWVAEITNTILQAEPANADARTLLADALEQMGFQAESGPWRNNFLSGASELRHGHPPASTPTAMPIVGRSDMTAMDPWMIFDYLAIHIVPENTPKNHKCLFVFPDLNENWLVEISNSALSAYPLDDKHAAAATSNRIELDKPSFVAILFGDITLDDAVQSGTVKIAGDKSAAATILALNTGFPFWFDLVGR